MKKRVFGQNLKLPMIPSLFSLKLHVLMLIRRIQCLMFNMLTKVLMERILLQDPWILSRFLQFQVLLKMISYTRDGIPNLLRCLQIEQSLLFMNHLWEIIMSNISLNRLQTLQKQCYSLLSAHMVQPLNTPEIFLNIQLKRLLINITYSKNGINQVLLLEIRKSIQYLIHVNIQLDILMEKT